MVVSTIDAITKLEEFLGLERCENDCIPEYYTSTACGSDGVEYSTGFSCEFAKAQCANKGLMRSRDRRYCKNSKIPTTDYRAGKENTVNECRDNRYIVVKDILKCKELATYIQKPFSSVNDDKHLKFCSIQGDQIFFNIYMKGSFKSPNDAPICVKDVEFIKLDKDVRNCPDGFKKITNDMECLLATEDLLNLEYKELKVEKQHKHVSGCYFNEGRKKDVLKKVFFNPHTGGDQDNSNNRIICQKD